jgi:cytoskeletal protein RodZ
MSGGPTRRRKHSPAVYRRRRLVVLLAALLIIAAVVWLLVAQPWRSVAAGLDAPTPQPAASSASPTATPSASPSTQAEEGAAETPAPSESPQAQPELTPSAEPCVAGSLLVEAVTDKSSYAQGENPQLSIRLTNQSDADCTLNVGTSAQAFEISSGSDVWWRSTDCQTEPSDMIVLLAAGQEVTSATPLTWDRTRSSVDTCSSERPQATGGGATYHLRVAIGGSSSANTASFQLY